MLGRGESPSLLEKYMRSPGDPVNWMNLPANQGIGHIWCPGYYGIATPNYPKGIKTPPSLVIVEPARYQVRECSIIKPKTEYNS